MKAIATLFYIGYLPIVPGTFGSMAALPLGYLIHRFFGFPAFAMITLAVFALGLYATAVWVRGSGQADPAEIVIDEVVGQWIALWPLSAGLWMAGAASNMFPWPGWVGAFVMFRLFDILKPWPVSWADNMHTPLGVMLDDVIAGVMAAACVAGAAWIAHGLMAQ